MKIVRKYLPTSTLVQFADEHNLTMFVGERDVNSASWITASSRFYAHFEHCDTKGDGVLIGEFGDGPTEEDAIVDYTRKISGKTIVHFDPKDGYKRSEYKVPILTGN